MSFSTDSFDLKTRINDEYSLYKAPWAVYSGAYDVNDLWKRSRPNYEIRSVKNENDVPKNTYMYTLKNRHR